MKIVRAAALAFVCAIVACAQAGVGTDLDGGEFGDASTPDANARFDAAPEDAGSIDDADAAEFVDVYDAGPAVGSLAYQCPVHASVGCVSASACESTCIGQFQGSPTCTWYSSGGTPNVLSCTAVTEITAVSTCPSELSTNCMDMTVCESTCVGQLQPTSTCSVSGTGGVATPVSCTNNLGQGTVSLYQCPVLASTGCTDTSQCESTCVGQITSSPTCTSRLANAVANSVNCAALPSQSF